MYKYIYSSLLIFVLAFISCNHKSKSSLFLENAVKIVDEDPEYAVKLIDSIDFPESSLNKAEYMQYLVTKVQSYHKNFRNIEYDTLIFKAADYFIENNVSPDKTALALFYSGTVLRARKQFNDAMQYYKDAQSYSDQTSNQSLKGLIDFNIGDLLSGQGLRLDALQYYKKAANYYKDTPKNKVKTFSEMGRMFLFEGEKDSAFFYFEKGLKLADSIKNDDLITTLTLNIGVAYETAKQYDEAEKYLRRSFYLNKDSTDTPRYLLNFAEVYNKAGQIDSANIYAIALKRHLPKIKENYLLAASLKFLANWEKQNNNINNAFDYERQRITALTNILKDRQQRDAYQIEQRYNFEYMQTQYYKGISARQKWIIILLTSSILLGVCFVIYWIRQKNKEILLQSSMDTLKDMNRDLWDLNNNLTALVNKKQSDLRRELLWRFDVAKKVLKLNEETKRENSKNDREKKLVLEKFNRILYGDSSSDEQWMLLLQTFDNARPGYSKMIKEKWPELTESELRICILTYANFSIKEASIVLNQSPNTIQTRRTSLRKKIGAPLAGNIAEYIDGIQI